MNHLTDNNWVKSGPVSSGFGDEEITSYTMDIPLLRTDPVLGGIRIVIDEHENPWGGKKVAHLYYVDNSRIPSNTYSISPSISVWCTGATTDQIVEYLLEAQQRLQDHKLTYSKFPWENKSKQEKP